MKQHQCPCGESNPDNFYKSEKGRCRKCHIRDSNNWNRENLIEYRVQQAKTRAKKKGIEFELVANDIEVLLTKQNNSCAYSQVPFDNDKEYVSMSIDRIDSSRGYTPDNIQLVSSYVNRMKSDVTEYQFIWMCRKIAKETNERWKRMTP